MADADVAASGGACVGSMVVRAAGPGVTRASLTQAMSTMGRLDLGGYSYEFTPQNRHGSNFVDIAVVSSGGTYRH